MMGALEAANGMLLFGISTAFIFTVIKFYYEHLVFRVLPGLSGRADQEPIAKVIDRSPTGGNHHDSVAVFAGDVETDR
jgi:hypothetical protein